MDPSALALVASLYPLSPEGPPSAIIEWRDRVQRVLLDPPVTRLRVRTHPSDISLIPALSSPLLTIERSAPLKRSLIDQPNDYRASTTTKFGERLIFRKRTTDTTYTNNQEPLTRRLTSIINSKKISNHPFNTSKKSVLIISLPQDHQGAQNQQTKKDDQMKKKKIVKEKLTRITSGPENFGWAPLAWAHTEE
ncbi:hypothetical protein [Pseudomonas laurylsulfatiphila]|uniref:hypothetical protein n=1 Tax=Pseudomonas laurylsulfatiphila TaxID=2011015 RepID=UPI003D1FFBF2